MAASFEEATILKNRYVVGNVASAELECWDIRFRIDTNIII